MCRARADFDHNVRSGAFGRLGIWGSNDYGKGSKGNRANRSVERTDGPCQGYAGFISDAQSPRGCDLSAMAMLISIILMSMCPDAAHVAYILTVAEFYSVGGPTWR